MLVRCRASLCVRFLQRFLAFFGDSQRMLGGCLADTRTVFGILAIVLRYSMNNLGILVILELLNIPATVTRLSGYKFLTV